MLFRPVNLAIVDDHSLFRKTLKNYLGEQKNVKVTMVCSDVNELLDQLRTSIPVDILLLDIFLPGVNGDEAIDLILEVRPELKILVLSMSTDVLLISDMLESGIHGYISKADEPEELMRAIETISENRVYRNGLFTEAIYLHLQNKKKNGTETINLTERDKRIIQLMWEEKSSKEIGEELCLGVRSVEKIRQEIKEKVGAKSLAGLFKCAIAWKIIPVGKIKVECLGLQQ